eukprot:TRINITY_DN6043_c0_g1_i1.p1 TRINITY_DN6043_c0_g1~~TRINITY_DN6043_c0_g1_i1.p1  ORF type:complete len:277 (+),score=92.25 TRINITY_DN6043_c0_g1_i1:59-832(+)
MARCLAVGHRGAGALAPDNTLPAFRLAAQLGLDAIETDLQVTSDDVVILWHDDTVPKIAGEDADPLLVTLTADALRARHPEVPTLREMLEVLQPTPVRLILELKGCSWEKAPEATVRGRLALVLALVEEFGVAPRVLFSSFRHSVLPLIGGGFPTAALFNAFGSPTPPDFLETCLRLKVQEAHLSGPALLAGPADAAALHKHGLRIMAWYPGNQEETEEEVQNLIHKLGVHAICGNRCDALVRLCANAAMGGDTERP